MSSGYVQARLRCARVHCVRRLHSGLGYALWVSRWFLLVHPCSFVGLQHLRRRDVFAVEQYHVHSLPVRHLLSRQ